MVGSSSSSSDVDHEEAEKLRSVAIDSCAVAQQASLQHRSTRKKQQQQRDDDDEDAAVDSGGSLKFYQTRAQHLLHEYLDKTIETELVTVDAFERAHCGAETLDAGFYLFKHAPPGLVDKSPGKDGKEMQARKRRKHGKSGPDESSELFRSNVLAASVDGATVKLCAEKAVSKALSMWVVQQAAEKEDERLENERVAMLKQQRGEKWLPSVARDIGVIMMQQMKPISPSTRSKEIISFNRQSYYQEDDTGSSKNHVHKKEGKANNESQKKYKKEKQAIIEESTA